MCSGTYADPSIENPEEVYLLKSGKFIKIYVFIATGLLCVPIVILLIAMLIIRAVNKREQKKLEKTKNFNTDDSPHGAEL